VEVLTLERSLPFAVLDVEHRAAMLVAEIQKRLPFPDPRLLVLEALIDELKALPNRGKGEPMSQAQVLVRIHVWSEGEDCF